MIESITSSKITVLFVVTLCFLTSSQKLKKKNQFYQIQVIYVPQPLPLPTHFSYPHLWVRNQSDLIRTSKVKMLGRQETEGLKSRTQNYRQLKRVKMLQTRFPSMLSSSKNNFALFCNPFLRHYSQCTNFFKKGKDSFISQLEQRKQELKRKVGQLAYIFLLQKFGIRASRKFPFQILFRRGKLAI